MQLKDTELESLEVAFARIIMNHEFQSMRFGGLEIKRKGPLIHSKWFTIVTEQYPKEKNPYLVFGLM